MNQEEINYLRKYYGRFMGYNKAEDAPTIEEEEWNNLVDSADAVMEKIGRHGKNQEMRYCNNK